MRAPRRRTLRKGGRRAEAPFQGASAALSMATLAGAACVGRHELPCRHTAREFFPSQGTNDNVFDWSKGGMRVSRCLRSSSGVSISSSNMVSKLPRPASEFRTSSPGSSSMITRLKKKESTLYERTSFLHSDYITLISERSVDR